MKIAHVGVLCAAMLTGQCWGMNVGQGAVDGGAVVSEFDRAIAEVQYILQSVGNWVQQNGTQKHARLVRYAGRQLCKVDVSEDYWTYFWLIDSLRDIAKDVLPADAALRIDLLRVINDLEIASAPHSTEWRRSFERVAYAAINFLDELEEFLRPSRHAPVPQQVSVAIDLIDAFRDAPSYQTLQACCAQLVALPELIAAGDARRSQRERMQRVIGGLMNLHVDVAEE